MIDSTALVAALKAQVLTLEGDLRVRVDAQPEVSERWRAEHRRVLAAERTASSWTEWRDDRVTQAAVAWVLTTVFVRFSEDNGLIKPVWITGPGSRRQEALDAQLAFFRGQPEATDREWVLEAVSYLRRLPSTAGLVDDYSPLWSVSPSGQAVSDLLAFWRERDADGQLRWDFAAPDWSTRFLGDLYQDLSEYAKKTYALLQTPEFVEEFILDQTLEPALKERRLEGFSVIDPTCGSGHFLLGAFARLLERWGYEAPGLELQLRVQKALDAVHGVDLNPFAVAIAKFRLTIAALHACGLRTLEQAPAFDYHVAAGDSLLFGRRQEALPFAGADEDEALSAMVQSSEDLEQLKEILEPRQYDVVVGNPPYITVKDKRLNEAYRQRYATCKGTYALTVPFMERFYDLAKPLTGDRAAGWVGQITSNSFMKREFGSKVIENLLARKDLRLIADTSGAYVPGHGTPTVILVGRNQTPSGATVRSVLGVRGEPGRPDDPSRGVVWRSIVEHVGDPGWGNRWVTVTDLKRERLKRHPWSLSGGGASDLLSSLDASAGRLGALISRSGMFGDSHAEDLLAAPVGAFSRLGVDSGDIVAAINGDTVRDWVATQAGELLLAPGPVAQPTPAQQTLKALWPWRTSAWDRATFSAGSYRQAGRHWLSWHQVSVRQRDQTRLVFAKIATHNQFALTREPWIEKPSALRVELPAGATEGDHLGLLGVLNSSTACFWLKENCHAKGSQSGTGGFMHDAWEEFTEFTGTTLQDFPLPSVLPFERAQLIESLARQLVEESPESVAARLVPTALAFNQVRTNFERLRSQMVSAQEELDWEVYQHYGLVANDLTSSTTDLPGLILGERAFEIALARQVTAGNEETVWFTRHGSTPVTEIPARWPAAYRELVQRRLDLIESDPSVALLESPEHKRRWASESWESMQQRALRDWLLDRLEDKRYWFNGPTPTPRSVSQLADEVGRDEDLMSVLALWEGRPDVPIVQSLTKLLTDEAVPFLAAYRLKDSGLRKFEAWQETWDLQRQEDAGMQVGVIPVPPKYTNADFRKASWWQARGKLDVPKERFILYPNAGRATDSTLLLGWAGWDHAEQALALATIIGEREAEGRSDEDLVPLVAGLAELQAWVEQWHADVHPVYGQSLAVFCREQLADRSRQVNQSVEQLAAWRPPATTRGRKAKA